MSKKKYTIEDIRELAKSKNGKCVSDNYINAHTKLKWQCNICNNVWKATPNNIRQGRWCPECAKKITGDKNRKYSIQDIQKLAQKRGGKCLSEKYVNNYTKMKWECSEKHIWEAIWRDIQQGHWCPKCIGRNKTIKNMQKLAKERDGECLSKEYIDANTKLLWKCNICDHKWKATPSNIQQGKWCPKCVGKNKTIEDMRELAKSKNGKCLSKKYSGSKTKLKWQCEKMHTWYTPPSYIVHGNWCPYCKNKSEQNFREIIEKILNAKLPKRKPKWLVNENGNRLELDGYNEKLGIAFEYQGEQHFNVVNNNYFGGEKALVKRQKHDSIKKELCKKHNVVLLCPTHKLGKTKYENFIKNKLKENNLTYLLNS